MEPACTSSHPLNFTSRRTWFGRLPGVPLVPASLSIWLAAGLAVTPGLVAWWTGRAVLARVDDPVLPELLFERQRRLGTFALAGAILLALFFADDALWAIPLLFLVLLVSAYPLRRTLFGERLGALAYLRYAVFSRVGHVGLPLLAAFAPAVVTSLAIGLEPNDVERAARIALFTGVAFGIVIALWQHFYPHVFLALHRAEPLRAKSRPELIARLDAILDAASGALRRRPAVYRYGAPGAYVMNAVAIPSLTWPAVALGDTLLATLDDDEIVAVFAHEVAHHEQFTRRRLWRAWFSGVFLAVLTSILPALLVRALPAVALLSTWGFALAVVISLGKRAAKRRDLETAGDLRASVLSGNPKALASALTKIHVYSRVPRRWPHAVESAATHPSLARRIQALRERSGTMEPHVPNVSTVVRSTSGSVVALERDRVYWFKGVADDAPLTLDALRASASSYRATAYRDLAELRIAAEGTARLLVATDLENRSWKTSIAPNDIAAVQAALDQVDVKLGHRRVAVAPASAPAVRWLALALLVLLGMAGELGFVFLPLVLVLIRPTLTAAIAATAAIALARVVVAARVISWADPVRQIAALGAVAVAITLTALAARRARLDPSRAASRRILREAWLLIGVLGAVVAILVISIAPLAGVRPTSLVGNQLAISAAILLLGIGGALLTLPQRWWRLGGVLVTCVGFGAGAVVARDAWPFGRTRLLTWTTGGLIGAGNVSIAGGALTLTVSPNGSAFAVTQYHRMARGIDGTRYVIGRFGDSVQTLRTSDAAKIVFLDDQTLLALDANDADSLELRSERVTQDAGGGVAVLWRQRLPLIDSPELFVDRERHSWIVTGRAADGQSLVVVSDTFGGIRPKVSRLATIREEQETGEQMSQSIAAFADGSMLWATLGGIRSTPQLMPLLLAMAGSMRWELRSSGRGGEHFVAELDGFPLCASEVDQGVLCVDRGSDATGIWRVSSASTIQRIAELPPAFDVIHIESADRVAAAERFGTRAVIVDPSTRHALRLTLASASQRGTGRWTADVATRGEYLFVLSGGRDASTVNRYRIR